MSPAEKSARELLAQLPPYLIDQDKALAIIESFLAERDAKIAISNAAITYVLCQIRENKKLLYHFHLTAKMEKLCEAYAALNDKQVPDVEDFFTGGSDKL